MKEQNSGRPSMTFEQVKEEIKRRADLAGIVSRHTKLQKSSAGFKACCPLPGHKEKTPSFTINTRENFFYCYGCSRGGDVFKFLELVEGVPFAEAMKELAQSLNLELPAPKGAGGRSVDPAAAAAKKDAQLAGYELLKRTAQFYQRILKDALSPGAKIAKSYLEKRGISSELQEEFQIGWALEDNQGLAKKLNKADDKKIALATHMIREYNGKAYDMFVERLMIPVRDVRGRVVAFSGRTLKSGTDDGPKYINSKDSEWFKKKETLYGLYESISLIREQGYVTIVEGFFDQWAFHRRGVPSVAAMGTALGEAHLDILGRFTKQIILVMDADRAGIESTKRSLPIFYERGFDVKVFAEIEGKDPDEWLSQHKDLETEQLAQKLKSAPEALEWWARQILIEGQREQMSRVQLLKALVPVWSQARSVAHRSVLSDEVGRLLGLNAGDVQKSLEELSPKTAAKVSHERGQVQRSAPESRERVVPFAPSSRIDKATEEVLVLAVTHWELLQPKSNEAWAQWERYFGKTVAQSFIQKLSGIWYQSGGLLGREHLRAALADEALDPLVKRALFRGLGSETSADTEASKITKAWHELALILHREKCSAELAQLQSQLRSVSSESEEANTLLKRLQELRIELEKA